MEDLQAVNDIINNAVKDSSYITIIISSSVFILYTLIVKLVELFKAKDGNKPLIEMANSIKEVSENVVILNQVLHKTFDEAEVKDATKLNNIVDTTFKSFKSEITEQCIDIIIHNNIQENIEQIKQTIYKFANTEYYKIYSILSAYERNGVNIATKIKEEWIDDITKTCLSIIYNNNDAIDRIRQLNSKINLMSEGYSIYLKNKIINH